MAPLNVDDLIPFLSPDRELHGTNLVDRIHRQKGKAELDLSLSNITTVPLDTIKLYYGEPSDLDLSYNLITNLTPQFICDMANLTKLDLSRNSLKALPDDFGTMSKLIYLDLHQNKLETLPVSMGKMGRLGYLNISGNPFLPPLSNFLELEATKQEVENSNIKLAQTVVNFLTEIAVRTVGAGDLVAPKILIDHNRNVTFDLEAAASDHAKIKDVSSRADEENNNKPPEQLIPVPEEVSRRRLLRKVKEKESVSSHPKTILYSAGNEARLKESIRLQNVMKGIGCLLILTLLLPFIIGMMANTFYFDNLAKKHNGFNQIWTVYKPVDNIVTLILRDFFNLNTPLTVQAQLPVTRHFFYEMFTYRYQLESLKLVYYFVTFGPYRGQSYNYEYFDSLKLF